MKFKKSLATIIAVLVTFSMMSAANPTKLDANERAKKMIEKLEMDIKLTPDQKTIILELSKIHFAKIEQARQMSNKSEANAIIKSQQSEFKIQVESELTEEQLKLIKNKDEALKNEIRKKITKQISKKK